jgi:hypothetical protein
MVEDWWTEIKKSQIHLIDIHGWFKEENKQKFVSEYTYK